MNILKTLFVAAALMIPTLIAASDRPLTTIFTASQRGTYYQIGQDLQRACPQLNIQVVLTYGSLDNINQLIQAPVLRTGHRFALVQNDALTSVLGTEPRARSLIKPIMSMYAEDITVLVNRGAKINTLKDLNGKRVSVGVVGSGTWFSASAIKTQLSINWITVERSPEESMLGVLTGELDAMIMVGGHPIKMYTELGAAMKDLVKLIDLTDRELDKVYIASKLPENTYPWQDREVELRITRSIFVTASDVPSTVVNKLLSCMADTQHELRRWGHPKWNSVQFPAPKTKK